MYKYLLLLLFCQLSFSQIKVLDSISQSPVSYATVSFGNGQGIFADDDGVFYFTKKLYPDVDSLHISAIGFKNLNIAAENLPNQLLLQPQADALDEVVLSTNLNRKFKQFHYGYLHTNDTVIIYA